MSQSRSRILDPVIKGWRQLSKRESESVSFGGNVAPSLNGVDPSFVNSVAGSYL
jgi:hypothetical protein